MSETATEVRVEREGGVMRLVLNRPESLNSVNGPMTVQLENALDEAAKDPQVRVVVLTGEGRGFCSGADLQRDRSADTSGNKESVLTVINRIIPKITALGKPVVGAINGAAAGVGASFALACDLVIAKESAYFLLAFARIGLMPDGGATLLVPALVGRSRAMEMALLADKIPAAKAEEWGLIYRSVPDAEFDGTVNALVEKLVAGPTQSYAASKRAINTNTIALLEAALEAEEEGQTKLLSTKDNAEGVLAFVEKRAAKFTGE
ncbi:enoyl-CoA hydratase [Antricoccus suffuscus]|uniref:Enoyl-CoA hydratase n=1 Tax=Antricoccus suffuscus TaxID=1629062 RepID=A0A2T1A2C3_9ACTN|nr:enoyl-CoA hydratase [Antricoccus suffuscus]PRZ42761.1 enoyl-CoA hydratase [Antricoccus suffuscus]